MSNCKRTMTHSTETGVYVPHTQADIHAPHQGIYFHLIPCTPSWQTFAIYPGENLPGQPQSTSVRMHAPHASAI